MDFSIHEICNPDVLTLRQLDYAIKYLLPDPETAPKEYFWTKFPVQLPRVFERSIGEMNLEMYEEKREIVTYYFRLTEYCKGPFSKRRWVFYGGLICEH